MSIKVNFNGVSILKPGAYSILNTSLLTESPLGDSGIVGIIGEADAGAPRVLDVLSQSQIQSAKIRYKGGPIAKALDLLAQPSNDPRIPNGASRIIIYKTNLSTISEKSMLSDFTAAPAMLTLDSQNYGTDENNINIQMTAGAILDSNATVTGTLAGPFTMAGGDTLIVEHVGVTYTYTSTLGAGAKTAAALQVDMDNAANWAPSKPVTVAVETGDFISVTLTSAADADRLEYGIMQISAASVDLDVLLGLSTALTRGVKGSRIAIVNKGTTTDTTPDLGGVALLSIQYTGAGTAATLAIQDVATVKTLTTTVTGGPGSEDLSIAIDAITVAQLVAQINASSVYTCTTTYYNAVGDLAGDVLDYYSALDIDTMSAVLYGTVIAMYQEMLSVSQLITPTLVSNIEGQLALVTAASYFTGGTLGDSANSNFQSGFDAMKSVRANIVIPLCSKDAVGASTYTISSVNAQADAHCSYMASTLGKSERNCYVSQHGTKTVVKAAARAINSRHTSMVAQQPTVLNELGTLEVMEEYAMACICAGMQAGSEVGEPITYKAIRVSAITQDSSWEPAIDFDEMIEAGVTFAEQTDAGAFRIVVGNTTYSQDSNIVFNRISINEAGNYVAFELRTHLETLFTGTKARTGSASAIKNAAIAKLKQLRDEDIIVDGNETDGTIIPAYRNLNVVISGVTATLDVTITPVPGIDFILTTIYLTSLQASASA